MDNTELHIILLWEKARYKEQEIIEDIKKQLKILEVIDVKWSEENASSNFSRFYGTKLPSGSHKEIECGTGNFLVITVLDENPKYDFAETSRGYEYVNINIFNLKQRYRSWTNGGHKIHTTNNTKETNHDITLLLGINYGDYLQTKNTEWTGTIEYIERDLTGCSNWSSLEELFYTLNATTNYVVLRNCEILPKAFKSEEHGDIDILTDDYENICYIANTTPVFLEPYRVHNYTLINDEQVFFDFRYLHDDYYCYKFEKDILNSKYLNENNIYVPDNEYSFYSLVYHALIHKRKVSSDYIEKVYELFKKLNLNKKDETFKADFELYYSLLLYFMNSKGYYFVRPKDKSVVYYEGNTKRREYIKWLEENYFIKEVTNYNIHDCGGAECIYFQGYLNGNKVFIKANGIGDINVNEFKMTETLYNLNPENFIKPYFYKYDKDIKNVVLEFLEGETLDKLLENNSLSNDDINIITKELDNIAKTLITAKIVHRDITLKNLLYTKNKHLKLIDLQWAVHYDKYIENAEVIKNPQLIKELGEEFFYGEYTWDDMYSISEILKLLKKESDFINNNIGKYVIRFELPAENNLINATPKVSFLEKIFSVKNIYKFNSKKKRIYILGFKITFKIKGEYNAK